MINIKQHIRKYAEIAVKNGDLSTTEDVQSLAQADHKTWLVSVANFQNNGKQIKIVLAPIENTNEYQVSDEHNHIIWQGQFTEANFNSIIQNVLMKLNIID
ncbi:hypothetical protein [Nicoliella lavandulae]|uniref:Uncharacterized protein n=1 Tax=Nicoliella lavandulae TaxID=3082954 RepID=A0ABU8SJA7_9LACO